jgi:hypothetical protein
MDEPQESIQPRRRKATNPPPVEESASVPSVSSDSWKPFEEAHQDYLRALQQVWTPQDAQRHVEEANIAYIRQVLEAQATGDIIRRFEVDLGYMRALQLPDQVRQQFDEVYRTYLRAVQEAWARLDVNALDANTLAAIGQLLLAASCAASPTISSSQASRT